MTKKTLMDTTAHLMGAMGRADKKFRDELVWSVIHICMSDRYALVTDFVWYLSVLADLIRVPSSSHGKLVGDQIIDVCLQRGSHSRIRRRYHVSDFDRPDSFRNVERE